MTITPSILGRVTTNLQEKTIVHCVVEKDLTLVKLCTSFESTKTGKLTQCLIMGMTLSSECTDQF